MQIMPRTGARFGYSVSALYDPHMNIQFGASYIARFLHSYGNATTALSAYNAGPGKVASGAIVSTDKAKSYRRALRDLDVRRHEAHASGAHAINRVNGLHGRIKEFIDGFRCVATRRLWNYLAWFKWIWSFKRGRTAAQTAGLIVKQVGSNPYKTTWRNYKRTPYPFYEYWVKQAKWDSRARAALPLAMGVVSKVG